MIRMLLIAAMLIALVVACSLRTHPAERSIPIPAETHEEVAPVEEHKPPPPSTFDDRLIQLQGQLDWVKHRIPGKGI